MASARRNGKMLAISHQISYSVVTQKLVPILVLVEETKMKWAVFYVYVKICYYFTWKRFPLYTCISLENGSFGSRLFFFHLKTVLSGWKGQRWSTPVWQASTPVWQASRDGKRLLHQLLRWMIFHGSLTVLKTALTQCNPCLFVFGLIFWLCGTRGITQNLLQVLCFFFRNCWIQRLPSTLAFFCNSWMQSLILTPLIKKKYF